MWKVILLFLFDMYSYCRAVTFMFFNVFCIMFVLQLNVIKEVSNI